MARDTNRLTPKRITDRTGRNTTVYVSTDGSGAKDVLQRNADIIKEAANKPPVGARSSGSVLSDSSMREAPTATLIAELRTSYWDYMDFMTSLDTQVNAASIEQQVTGISALEDAILARHNNIYGRALLDGVAQEMMSSAADSAESKARRANSPYTKLLADATGSARLSSSQIAAELDRLSEGQGWEGSDVWLRGSLNKLAAIEAVLERLPQEDQTGERQQLEAEASLLRDQVSQSKLDEIGII